MKKIIVERISHHGKERIALKFPYDSGLNAIIKKMPDAQWSKSIHSWLIDASSDALKTALGAFYEKAILEYDPLKLFPDERIKSPETDTRTSGNTVLPEIKEWPKMKIPKVSDLPELSDRAKQDIENYRKWMTANRYPETTIKTYTGMMVKFLRFVSPREAGECTSDDLINIVEQYILPNGFSQSFQNQLISSVKKFYSHIYRKTIDPGSIMRPRPRHHLPNVLGKEEVKKILSVIANEKHRVMLSLIYACGLRRSELIQIIPRDIERSRGLLRIRQAKGFKDRIVPVSERTLEMIDSYVDHYRPDRYLFEGQRAGERYSTSSLEKILKNACAKAGINKPVTLHWLRHSYATHLLESGTDLRYIQELLGHKSSKTTEIYTHVTTRGIQNIRSPFDDL
jgi:integrase/recombinase XerD